MVHPKFDHAISLRSALAGAAIGWLSARYGPLDEAGASLIGLVIGYLYDRLAFWVKTRFSAEAPDGVD